MTKANTNILSIGEVLWDLFAMGARFGGAPANFACHAAALGAGVSMVSAVGDDARGREAIRILNSYGIDTSLVARVADAPTGTVGVDLNTAGKPTFTIHQGVAWDRIEWTPQLASKVAEADAIYFGTLSQRQEVSRATVARALSRAKAVGVRRVLDVNLRRPFYDASLIRQSIAQASILKLSDDELTEVTSACGVALDDDPKVTLGALRSACQLDLVAMTRGPHGAVLVSDEEMVDQPGFPTDVVDTVGAGDSFTAALVTGLLRGDPLAAIARAACELAAKVCAQEGAVPDLSRQTTS